LDHMPIVIVLGTWLEAQDEAPWENFKVADWGKVHDEMAARLGEIEL